MMGSDESQWTMTNAMGAVDTVIIWSFDPRPTSAATGSNSRSNAFKMLSTTFRRLLSEIHGVKPRRSSERARSQECW